MLDDVTPCYRANISPDLVALIKGLHPSARSVPQQGHDRDLPSQPRRLPDLPEWAQVVLRQDGRRPVRTEALLVWAHEDVLAVTFAGASVPVSRRLSIYVGRHRGVLVHLCHQPPEGYPARAVYRVFHLGTAQDLSESLRKHPPELCFEVSARTAHCQDAGLPAPLVSSVPI